MKLCPLIAPLTQVLPFPLYNIEEVVNSQRWRTILLTSKTVLPLINAAHAFLQKVFIVKCKQQIHVCAKC